MLLVLSEGTSPSPTITEPVGSDSGPWIPDTPLTSDVITVGVGNSADSEGTEDPKEPEGTAGCEGVSTRSTGTTEFTPGPYPTREELLEGIKSDFACDSYPDQGKASLRVSVVAVRHCAASERMASTNASLCCLSGHTINILTSVAVEGSVATYLSSEARVRANSDASTSSSSVTSTALSEWDCMYDQGAIGEPNAAVCAVCGVCGVCTVCCPCASIEGIAREVEAIEEVSSVLLSGSTEFAVSSLSLCMLPLEEKLFNPPFPGEDGGMEEVGDGEE